MTRRTSSASTRDLLNSISNPTFTRDKFLKEARLADADLQRFAESINAISIKNQSAKTVVQPDKEKKLASDIETKSRETNKLANDIRSRLRQMERANPPHNHEFVLRSNQNSRLAKRFMEELVRYQQVQQDFKRTRQERLMRQYRIANPNATEQDMRNAIRNYETAGTSLEGGIFSQTVMSKKFGPARKDMDELKQRHDEIVQLAVSINALQQLFIQMQEIVKLHESVVLHLTDQVTATVGDTIDAAGAMKHAVISEKEARKKMWFIGAAVTTVVVAIGLIVFIWLKSNGMLDFMFPKAAAATAASIQAVLGQMPTIMLKPPVNDTAASNSTVVAAPIAPSADKALHVIAPPSAIPKT